MKVSVIGSRGIPNRYGGFEELAEKLAIGLAQMGHEITVYNPHNHPIKNFDVPNVRIVRIFNPEKILGSFGQFFYDLGAIIHTWFAPPDIILQLGYTSSSIWFRLLPRRSRVVTNMDGLEWKRSKYGKLVQNFLLFAEKLAAKHSHLLVADHLAIEDYIHEKYQSQVVYIPYGADIPQETNSTILHKLSLKKGAYHVLIARMEPENHITEILEGVANSTNSMPLIVVGGTSNHFGKKLKRKFAHNTKIRFVGGIYNKEDLNELRLNAQLYFHGHSVGGTNPSLLESMACKCAIVAHNNIFNKGVLGKNARYFTQPEQIETLLNAPFDVVKADKMARANLKSIRDKYNWRIVIEQYELAMKQMLI